MPDQEREKIVDRANRMLRQSKTLRKVSEELLQESQDLRQVARAVRSKPKPSRRKK